MKKTLLILILALASRIGVAQGDSCANAIPMPYSANSFINGNVLTALDSRWFAFVPLTTEVNIKLTNTNPVAGHIHDLLLVEGVCNPRYFVIGHDFGAGPVLSINVHEVIPGVPYYIVAMRERGSCPKCGTPGASFDLTAQSLAPPVITETNGIIYLNGVASHKKGEIILRINKSYLKMNAVNNLGQDDKPMPVFVQPAGIQDMANQIFNGNAPGLGTLKLKRVYPTLNPSNSGSVTRDNQAIPIPDFWETFILTVPDTLKLFRASRALDDVTAIRFAEPNYVVQFSSVPNDPSYANLQSSLHPTTSWPNANINVEGAWDIETGKQFVKVGVYDTGIDQTHSDLSGKIGGGYNFFAGSALASPYDNVGHGTSCSGIIGALRNNSTGIAGIAGGDNALSNPGSTIFDMRIADSNFAPNSTIANAITTGATSTGSGGYGLHIMSNSWGGGIFANVIHDAVQYADQNGVVVCASRGNFPNLQNIPLTGNNYPATFQDEMVVNVGASGTDGDWKTNGNGNPSDAGDNQYQSMYQHDVDIIAPGTNTVVWTTEFNTNGYVGFNGTSAACPHVSGMAALMLSHVDQATPNSSNLVIEDVENILQLSAVDKFTPGFDDHVGAGLINATTTMGKIKKPAYKIQHFGVGQNATSSVSQATIATAQQVILAQAYGVLAAGTYFADKVEVKITLNYNLSSVNDAILTSWVRFSSTLGWSLSNPINTDNWCEILSVTPTQAVLRTYIYNFKYDQMGNLITDPIYPTQFPKAALSIYTFDGTLSGVHEINSDGSTLSSVFPNPANNNANVLVFLPTSQEISLELYDTNGKLIKDVFKGKTDAGTHQYEVNLNEVSEGMYFLKLVTEKSTSGKKLIVSKK
jgi:subtilisin family serine protease